MRYVLLMTLIGACGAQSQPEPVETAHAGASANLEVKWVVDPPDSPPSGYNATWINEIYQEFHRKPRGEARLTVLAAMEPLQTDLVAWLREYYLEIPYSSHRKLQITEFLTIIDGDFWQLDTRIAVRDLLKEIAIATHNGPPLDRYNVYDSAIGGLGRHKAVSRLREIMRLGPEYLIRPASRRLYEIGGLNYTDKVYLLTYDIEYGGAVTDPDKINGGLWQ